MNIFVHLAINSFIGVSTGLVYDINEFSVGLYWGSFIFDVDHIFAHCINSKSLRLNKFFELHHKYHNKMEPRLYIFHTFEFVLFLYFSAIIFKSLFLKGLLYGWILHLLVDALCYIRYYGKDLSWLNYWFLFRWKNLK